MHSLSTIFLLPALLLLTTTATAHGPYIPSGSGSLPHYPTGTAPYPIHTGTGTGYHHHPFPTASSIPPSEAATTCALPTTVTTTTEITVTVTVPVGGGVVGTGTGTGVVGPTASAGLKRRMEMRGLGEEMGRKERKSGFWA